MYICRVYLLIQFVCEKLFPLKLAEGLYLVCHQECTGYIPRVLIL